VRGDSASKVHEHRLNFLSAGSNSITPPEKALLKPIDASRALPEFSTLGNAASARCEP
jgi:hypothetical protein